MIILDIDPDDNTSNIVSNNDFIKNKRKIFLSRSLNASETDAFHKEKLIMNQLDNNINNTNKNINFTKNYTNKYTELNGYKYRENNKPGSNKFIKCINDGDVKRFYENEIQTSYRKRTGMCKKKFKICEKNFKNV